LPSLASLAGIAEIAEEGADKAGASTELASD
jgi:hypothetical protein